MLWRRDPVARRGSEGHRPLEQKYGIISDCGAENLARFGATRQQLLQSQLFRSQVDVCCYVSQSCKLKINRLLRSAPSDVITYPPNFMMRRQSLDVFA